MNFNLGIGKLNDRQSQASESLEVLAKLNCHLGLDVTAGKFDHCTSRASLMEVREFCGKLHDQTDICGSKVFRVVSWNDNMRWNFAQFHLKIFIKTFSARF